jgi:glycosyltransferase involved in cell wall biosynthesis
MKQLHIVCLDVPYPPDYGGTIEMFHKIRALHTAGVLIHLHVFEYGRGVQPILESFCASVHYYRRMEGHKGLSMKLPYIVTSRANPELLERLSQDHYPILFEGVHTTYFLHNGALKGRTCFVRLHNLEHEYYSMLARSTRSPLKAFYYLFESRLLKKYEAELNGKAVLLTLTDQESASYKVCCPDSDIRSLSPFTGIDYTDIETGVGNFCLYHGNLSVAENEKAAIWLLKNVFRKLKIPLVIAGRKPSPYLVRLAHKWTHTCIVANPSDKELNDLIRKAQVHVLPSFSRTGIKFKLLNAAFRGKHIVCTEAMVGGTGLESACHIASSAEAFGSIVMQLFRKPFDEEEVHLREHLRKTLMDPAVQAQKLISWIW